MKSRVHAVTPSDKLQGAIGGVESEVKSDHGDQEIFIGTVTSATPVKESAWVMDLHVSVLSEIRHRCWRPASFSNRMETSR